MLKISEKYSIVRDILKCDFIRYSPSEITTLNAANSQIYINLPREDNVNSLLNRDLELNFEVLHAATNKRYADGDDIRFGNLGPIAFFSKYKQTTSSGKHLENIKHGHFACLMYKLLTTAKGCKDLSICFDRSRD